MLMCVAMWLVYDVNWCFFFKQKTADEMRMSDWSSDVCSSDLREHPGRRPGRGRCGGNGVLHPAVPEGLVHGQLVHGQRPFLGVAGSPALWSAVSQVVGSGSR